MPTIKPAQFPSIERDPQTLSRPVVPAASRPGAKAAPVKPAAQAKPAQVKPLGPAATDATPDREEKLARAIEVLRARSVQFYHPDRSKVTHSAPLGQIIDIKA